MTYRLGIVLAQKNVWDYDEFRQECISKGIEPLALGEWSTKVGNLQAAMYRYPDMNPFDAYLELIKDWNYGLPEEKPYQVIHMTDFKQQGCGGCGGGKVL